MGWERQPAGEEGKKHDMISRWGFRAIFCTWDFQCPLLIGDQAQAVDLVLVTLGEGGPAPVTLGHHGGGADACSSRRSRSSNACGGACGGTGSGHLRGGGGTCC